MKKHIITLLIFFLALPIIRANTFYFNITQENTVQEIKIELQTLINNAIANDTIIVTGSKTNVNAPLILTIHTEKTLLWQANYQSNTSFSGDCLIAFAGEGTFEVTNCTLSVSNAFTVMAGGENSTIIVSSTGKVQAFGNGDINAISTYGNVEIKDNAQVNGSIEEVIKTYGNNSVITMSGGEVSALSGNAIIAYGLNAKIIVTGGYVSNDADAGYPTLIAVNQNSEGTNIFIGGTAKIEAKKKGIVVQTFAKAIISGDAQINSLYIEENDYYAVRALGGIEIKDNAHITSKNGYAIQAHEIIISDRAKVNGSGLYTIHTGKDVCIKDKAQVTATDGFIFEDVIFTGITLEGGALFVYGADFSHILHSGDLSIITGSGVMMAWNKDAGNTNYEMYSTDDILIEPKTATAYWTRQDNKNGIFYADGENTGFIPLDVTVLSVSEPILSQLKLYPNPTTGAVKIETQSPVSSHDIEIFDMVGRKIEVNLSVSQQDATNTQIIDMFQIPSGMYFLKIGDKIGKVVRQ